MLFARRSKPSWRERARVAFWPRHSWSRSLRYIRLRLIRIDANPHEIALGVAAGVFAAVVPLLGVQMMLAVLLAFALRASIPAALLGTFIGNPLSWPAIWAVSYAAGSWLTGSELFLPVAEIEARVAHFATAIATLSPDIIYAAAAFVWPLLKPMLVGSLPLGLAMAAVIYYISRRAVTACQDLRTDSALAAA